MANTDTSQLRNRLATRAQGSGDQGERTAPPLALVVRQTIERQASAFRQVLPSVVDPERFSRLVITAVKATPDLMKCFSTVQGETSVLLAAMQAAAIGLEPNTPTQDCWLLPRRNQGVWEAQLSIGYRGYLKLARRSGTIKTIYAEVVREGDHFRWERGLEADVLEHRPSDGEQGDLTHAYAVARFTEGGYAFMVLNRRQVEARRAMADSWKSEKSRPYSPWTKWPDAMWRKSAIRALVPFLELSSDVEHAVSRDEARLVLSDDGAIDVARYELEAPEPPADVNPETGEIERPGESVPVQDIEAAAGHEVAADRPPHGTEDYVEATATADPPPPATPRVDDARGVAPADPLGPMSKAQQGMLFGLLAEIGIEDRRERLTWASATLGREVTTYNELTFTEASTLIDAAQRQTEIDPSPEDEDNPDGPLTNDQRAGLAARLREAKILGPQRFSWSGARIKRSINSFDELTYAEASTLIEQLDALLSDGPVQ